MNVVKYGALAGALMMSCGAQGANTLAQTVTANTGLVPSQQNFDFGAGPGPQNSNFSAINVSLAKFDLNTGILVTGYTDTRWAGGTLDGYMYKDSGSASYALASASLSAAFNGLPAGTGTRSYYINTPGPGPFSRSLNTQILGTVPTGSLADFASASAGESFDVAVTPSLSIDYVGNAGGFASGEFNGASVQAGITYLYLKHAQAAFDDAGTTSLTLDFGTIVQGAGQQKKVFSLKNIGDGNTAALDLDNVLSIGSGFSALFPSFAAGIEGGEAKNYEVAFDPATLGSQTGYFKLYVSDEDAGVGMRGTALFITATANVVAAAAAVPEPASWAMMLGGFGMLGTTMRRRRSAVRATYA